MRNRRGAAPPPAPEPILGEVKLTLLQEARLVQRPRRIHKEYSPQELELYLAWVNGEVGTTAVASVVGCKKQVVSLRAGNALSFMVRSGYVKLVRQP